MRNVSGYLTDELGVNKLIEQFVAMKWSKGDNIEDSLQAWERYKTEMSK